MEIRKLENPWSDDIMALVQALPLCWSVQDEMHIKPVDIVRNNDFENPEIGVTYRKDLFVNVTHWRYTSAEDLGRLIHERLADWFNEPGDLEIATAWATRALQGAVSVGEAASRRLGKQLHGGRLKDAVSQVDQYRKLFSADLAAARRACFLPELAAPYKPENTIHRFPGETLSEKWDRICNDLEAHMPEPWVKTRRFDGSHLKKGFVKAEPITISLDILKLSDVRTRWVEQEAARQATMKENAAKEVLGDDYETVVKNMKAGMPPQEAMTAEQIGKIRAEFARLDAVFAVEATERWGGSNGED